jgi:hypothetical protein
MFGPLADDRDPARAEYAGIVQTLLKATNGPVEPDENLSAYLEVLFTPAWSQLVSAQTAIVCADVSAPRDPEVYWRDIQAHRTSEPHFASLTRMLSPCAFWPTRPQEPPTEIANHERALIVGADGDPRVLYAGAAQLQKRLPAARLITLTNARKHGIFGEYGNTCVDDKVVAYLISGNLPATDQVC